MTTPEPRPRFTAEQVRELANECRSEDRIAAANSFLRPMLIDIRVTSALDAFADLLEAREQELKARDEHAAESARAARELKD